MNFQSALSELNRGKLVSRSRWNLHLSEGSYKNLSFIFLHDYAVEGASNILEKFKELAGSSGSVVLPHLRKKTRSVNAKGEYIYSIYTPAQEDLFAKDWYTIDLESSWGDVCGEPSRPAHTPGQEKITS